MASTATSALTSLAPADSKLVRRPQIMAAPQSVVLPSLPPTPHGASSSCSVGASSWKAASYCRRVARDIVARAAGAAPAEVAFELPEVVKTIQDAWNRMEDKYAMTSLAAAGFIGLWASSGVISAVDRLPLAPSVFELVGIGYTGWFVYQNVVFKEDRNVTSVDIGMNGEFNLIHNTKAERLRCPHRQGRRDLLPTIICVGGIEV